jgi:Holliday junction DNA helicase RuvA
MFEFFEGKFVEITPSYIVVNCGGVGYKIEISLNSYSILKDKTEGRVLVHHIVREDAQLLFGLKVKKFLLKRILKIKPI